MANLSSQHLHLRRRKRWIAPATLLRQSVSTLGRVVIARVEPEVDGGRFPLSARLGSACACARRFFDAGHDKLGAVLLYRAAVESAWREERCAWSTMTVGKRNFESKLLGRYRYTIGGVGGRFSVSLERGAREEFRGRPGCCHRYYD